MFLKRLIVSSFRLGVIRDIEFHIGVNLIIDRNTSSKEQTGNGVGKTTVLRALDFCFGAEQLNFYTDPEFKKENLVIKNYLIENEVEFCLILTKDLNNNAAPVIKIKRKITSETNKTKVIASINEESYTKAKDFNEALKRTIYLDSAIKPTIREIMGRVIRNSQDKMSNALKTIKMGSNTQYETLNLFMFGFGNSQILDEKQSVTKAYKLAKSDYEVITRHRSKNALEQAIAIINRDIIAQEELISNFQVADSYNDMLAELNELKIKISEVSITLSSLEFKKKLNDKAILDLEKSHENINPLDLQKLYLEATERLGNLNKEFSELLSFHNKMLVKKAEFIRKQMQPVLQEICRYKGELKSLLDMESELLKNLSSHGTLSDLQIMQKKLNSLFEEKGGLEEGLLQIQKVENELNILKTRFNNVLDRLKSKLDDFNKRLALFNSYFSLYTKILYQDEYILSYKDSSGSFVFTIEPLGTLLTSGNQGEGKKKAQVASLDFAYLSVQESLEARTPRFIAHDGIEAIHVNQINKLFEIASGINGQYILAILKDKLENVDQDFINKSVVLELGEGDKFFRL
ncbi:DUF2326 domain-containing protein [Escherichia coli]|uniref:DUF2326 domain-containing protein n=2 Tax=Escherichia coli TaxID=562 RepID=UPI000854D5E0|nr:DUF2326 domain-containing protein [Escherichia coli]EEW1629491.1 DUF2326 domain-containing protein [Escherichia coli]EFB2514222.1 DUF2326 domain-containing protein [Escherichia coli]EFJ8928322.1 DUF2326 domain-containing protein [Escherichia coli]EFN4018083.1 DUF2326 domain-containing protein [Escherichia coli]EFN4036807.1 DUF2326 domain-containing protein [Escherichia coli]